MSFTSASTLAAPTNVNVNGTCTLLMANAEVIQYQPGVNTVSALKLRRWVRFEIRTGWLIGENGHQIFLINHKWILKSMAGLLVSFVLLGWAKGSLMVVPAI